MGRVTAALIMLAVLMAGLGLSKASQAKEEISGAEILSRLEEVVKNQQAILQKLDEMKDELHTIKIRASRK